MASTEETRQLVAQIQEKREKAIEPLLGVLDERKRLLRLLSDLDEPYGKAYVEAEAAGWRTEELQDIGADEPVKRPKTRSRSRSKAQKSAAESAATASGTGTPTAVVPAQQSTGDAVAAAGSPSG
jgi:hypothetical protein